MTNDVDLEEPRDAMTTPWIHRDVHVTRLHVLGWIAWGLAMASLAVVAYAWGVHADKAQDSRAIALQVWNNSVQLFHDKVQDVDACHRQVETRSEARKTFLAGNDTDQVRTLSDRRQWEIIDAYVSGGLPDDLLASLLNEIDTIQLPQVTAARALIEATFPEYPPGYCPELPDPLVVPEVLEGIVEPPSVTDPPL